VIVGVIAVADLVARHAIDLGPKGVRRLPDARHCISWILPIPLLLFAGAVALPPLAALVRRTTTLPRLVAQAVGTTRAVIALVWVAWIAGWRRERHSSSSATSDDV
jgi:hypothetical protein